MPAIPGQRKVPQHTAQHPPLYYALVAAPLAIGVGSHHPLLGLRIARMQTLLFGLAGVLATAWVALAVRRRRDIAVGTAALAASVTAVVAAASPD